MKFLFTLLLVILSVHVFGAQERFSSRVEGSAIATGPLMDLYDDKYFEMGADPFWVTRYTNYKVSNKITLGLNRDVLQLNTFAAGSVALKITYETWNGSVFVPTVVNRTLTVSYDAANPLATVDDLSSFIFSNGHRVQVELISVTGLNVGDVYIESEINVERYYTFDGTAVTGASYAYTGTTNDYIDFSWNTKIGAEFYELEWVHINDYSLTEDDYISETNLNYNYYLNSTRISTKGNHYTIPKIFDHGYVIFRVRAIGMKGSTFLLRKDGEWNVAESGTIYTHPVAQRITIGGEYDPAMNWSHEVGYTEDGKRMEVVSFADGLGRGRQSVAHNTQTQQAVVSNVYYDNLGRPVISDLPTPVDGEQLKHYQDFNRADIVGTPSFQNEYFDIIDENDPCAIEARGFSTDHGAGQYYSPNNPDRFDENANIPDAEKFPYSRVTYLDDYTGRVLKVSGAGDDLKIGSGHETQFAYISSNQYELNKLFGTEVGLKDHYQKMVTLDANGQIYVQYSDMAGRVVASYMAGETPDNLSALQDNAENNVNVPLIVNGGGQTVNLTPVAPEAPYSSLTYDEYIYSEGQYKFSYGFTPEQYETSCMDNICFDCVYDLQLKIVDDCGQTKWDETIQINGESFDAVCNGVTSYTYMQNATDAFEEIALIPGKYNIYKKLSVNQAAIDEYWCFYVENNTCLPSISEEFNEEYTQEAFVECDEHVLPTTIEDDGCAAYKELMLIDVSPGGQYANYSWTTAGVYTCSDPTSIFYTGANPVLNGNWTSITYTGVDPSSLIINGTTYTSPSQITDLKTFIEHFHPSWAESLLDILHPERCYLDFCEANSTSNGYEDDMLAEYTFDGAVAQGFFRPIEGQSVSTTFIGNTPFNNYDPFFASGGFGATFANPNNTINDMLDDMQHYTDVAVSDGSPLALSMWQYAVLMAANCFEIGTLPTTAQVNACIANNERKDCIQDLIWINFRKYYLEQKQVYIYQAQQAYAVANGCDNSCIGVTPACSGQIGLLSSKASIFGNIAQFGSNATSAATMENTVNAQIELTCDNSCEQYAQDWINQLAGCNIPSNQLASIKADLKDLCMSGCDINHPTGSSTSVTGTTIDDILENHNIDITNLCTGLLISEPEPYRPITAMLQSVLIPLDECACDKLSQAEADFISHTNANTLPVGVTNKEQMLAYSLGVSMEDIDHLLCVCKQADGTEGNPAQFGWTTNSFGTMINPRYNIPGELGCETGSGVNCLNCDTINYDITNLMLLFPAYTSFEDFQDEENFPQILTNYLNNTHFFNLSYTDYADFIGGCRATSTNPYCKVNPLAEEWAQVMKLITFRGDLLSTEANPAHLLAENIVYAKGELQHTFSGNDYWSETNGNDITLHFGENSTTNCTITLTKDQAISFSDIVSFGGIYPLTKSCPNTNNTFEIEIQYLKCGVLTNGMLTGTSTCFEINECVCGDDGQLLCNEITTLEEDVCYQPRLDQMYQNAITTYEEAIVGVYEEFSADYNAKCAESFSTEHFEYNGSNNVYQFTLFYYDQAGNLVQTIAPQGIDFPYQTSTTITTVDADRTTLTPNIPDHHFETTYKYNSYDQLVETSNPDQDGATKFWYDAYGRIVASQNPVQAIESKYSYSLYDKQGRPIEVGQVVHAPITEADVKDENFVPGLIFRNWVYAGVRSEITMTQYDKPSTLESRFATGKQENLRLRVAGVYYYENQVDADYTSAIHYSYDIHGNVKEQLQDVPMMLAVEQDVKSTQYEYELISGNVQKVSYQKGEPDYMAHSYEYDQLNRLTEVHTTTNDVHQTQEAHYRYYDYGPMARTEIGEYKVQGSDFAYTINGWIKGMNSSTLDITRDMGRDGATGYLPQNNVVHEEFARDVVAYTLGYFQGDYKAIGTSTMEADYSGGNVFNQGSTNLYNGNIRNIVTSIDGMSTMGTAYGYDQLQRLKEMNAYYMSSSTTNDWINSTHTDEYFNSYIYDRNGNITDLKRNGNATTGLAMDDFVYKYDETLHGGYNNRLSWVDDEAGISMYADQDIDESMNAGNYDYDKLGQLVMDIDEGIDEIVWRKGDKKIKEIIRSITKPNASEVEFIYNPFGQRIIKIVKPRNGGTLSAEVDWTYNYYAYDANGQVMAIYDVQKSTTNNKATLEERNIYGAGRIGILKSQIVLFDNGNYPQTGATIVKNTLGNRQYEITNHLGNVNAVITDRKTVEIGGLSSIYVATKIMTSDYYPFGMEMPGRKTSSSDYRFGYNGMEKDKEIKGDGNSYTTEFRQYDPRLGRWLSLDPLMSDFPWMSPYVAFDNNPVVYTDPLGLAAEGFGDRRKEKAKDKEKIHTLDEVVIVAKRKPTEANLVRTIFRGIRGFGRSLARSGNRFAKQIKMKESLDAAMAAIDAALTYYSNERKTIIKNETNCEYRERYNDEIRPKLKPESYQESRNPYDVDAMKQAQEGGGKKILSYERAGVNYDKYSVSSFDDNGNLKSEVHYEVDTQTGKKLNFKYIDIENRKFNNKMKAEFKTTIQKQKANEIEMKVKELKQNKAELQKKIMRLIQKNPNLKR